MTRTNTTRQPEESQIDSPGFYANAKWCMEHLDQDPDRIEFSDVPNRAVLELLRWARNDPKAFFPLFARLDAQQNQQTQVAKVFAEDQRRHFTLFDRLLAHYELQQSELPTDSPEARPSSRVDATPS